MTLIERIINLYQGNPRVALLMSGKGSNAEVILKNRIRYPNLEFIAICTDQRRSNAQLLAKNFNLGYVYVEGSVSTLEERHAFFNVLSERLDSLDIDLLIYAGFMKIAPSFFLHQFPGINIHPADLTLKEASGKPKYTGMHAIADAIKDGRIYIASTVHVIEDEVDCGFPIAVSRHLPVKLSDLSNISVLHECLKKQCEHELYPKAIELLSHGKLSIHDLPLQGERLLKT
jgi:phosphoribosylglycinamide formyltransferase 1